MSSLNAKRRWSGWVSWLFLGVTIFSPATLHAELDLPDPGCQSAWTGRADALLLRRSRPDTQVLAQDTTDPTRNFNARDFDFDWRAGWQLELVRELDGDRRLEARLMVIDSWNTGAMAALMSTLLDPLQVNSNPPVFAPNVQTIDARYTSALTSVEANYAADFGTYWTWLVGFRYIELDERIRAGLDANPQFFVYDATTRNRLFGFQTGVAANVWESARWSVDGVMKAGIYHNSSGHAAILDTPAAQPVNGSANRAAFAGELGVNIRYHLSQNIAVRAGYDLLWLETVALASDQIPATDFFAGDGIAPGGGVLFHGAVLGLEATY